MKQPSDPAGPPAGSDVPAVRLARELALLDLPPRRWTRLADSGAETDVLVVGAGMCGLAAAIALKLKGIHDVMVVDGAEAGREGPWVTTARMETLRSPKHLTGPAQCIPSLTFRAWYEARHGAGGWAALGKIPRATWMDYLVWLRGAAGVEVRNGTHLRLLEPQGTHLRAHLEDVSGLRTIRARRVVLATGRLGAGGAARPDCAPPGLAPQATAHSSDPIDFAALAGRRVTVIGGGASAWDNAATAAEAGAAAVDLMIRRPMLPQVNKSKGALAPGFQWGLPELDDERRWRVLAYLYDNPSPPPVETVRRAMALPALRVRPGTTVDRVGDAGPGLVLHLADGTSERTDFLILGTGFRIDLAQRPELARLVPHVVTWGDAYTPPEALRREGLERYPYLGPAFELTPGPQGPAAIRSVYLFNIGAFASLGALSGDIPGIDAGSARLAAAVTRSLFGEDFEGLFRGLEEFDERELAGTPYLA